MKKLLMIAISLMMATALSACSPKDNPCNADEKNSDMKIQIKVGTNTFTATLADNATAKAFVEMLPLSMNMTDHLRNEKYYDLPNSLPTDTFRPGTIRTGDILLWGARTLVLFYKTFSSSYSYTRIGCVDDTTGLANALGSGNVVVVFERLQE
jgi:hypothetical protein